jgi:hypothetical protein
VGETVSDVQDKGWSAGLRMFDISTPEQPREIGFLSLSGIGIHRIWYVGGRWAYVSALIDGFTDYIFLTIDLADPRKPEVAGRWWLPGMNQAAGRPGLAAGQTLCAASRDYRRGYRLRQLARRRPDAAG